MMEAKFERPLWQVSQLLGTVVEQQQDMCNDHKTEAAVALKMEKYLSWKSQSQPQTGKEI
jgi:hypothetical protein